MKTVLLVTEKETPAFTAMGNCILPLAKERQWAVHVIGGGATTSAAELLGAWNPDGCILYVPQTRNVATAAQRLRIPMVIISPPFAARHATVVAHDSHSTGALAARELVKLGLDDFAFAAAEPDTPWVKARLAGFREVLGRCGRAASVFDGGSLRKWLKSLPKPCGLFAANDMTAEKIVATAVAAGIDIPFDLAVLGCDDDSRICEHAEITISSIRPDYVKCGMLAVDALAAAMNGKRPASHRMLFGDMGVTRRASTRLTAGRRPEISSALEYIRANATTGITAADVVVRLKGSRRSAENAVRAATGHSILEEIQQVRLEEAKRLLLDPLVKIGSVAARVGYTSENFMTRLFRRETGMTPTQWRTTSASSATIVSRVEGPAPRTTLKFSSTTPSACRT